MESMNPDLDDELDKIPLWLGSDDKVNEVLYCQEFLGRRPMKCIGGKLFTVDGLIDDEERVKAMIFEDFQPHISRDIAKTVKRAFDALKLMAYAPPMPTQTDRLHVANGTLILTTDPGVAEYGQLLADKEFCLNRLNVAYNPEAPPPATWLRFLEDLLEPGDIFTLQEFLGYCLIPTNRAQKMLVIVGKGGEGKSRIGLVMQEILGDSMNTTSIQKVETNRFARADLEFKLLMVDDDMVMKALPQTSYIKIMVTNEGKMDIETKGKQSVQRQLYVRFLCFGNGSLSSLYDKSQGFYRRQIILYTKDKPPDRQDDRNLIDKLRSEKEGIFLWMLEGLRRLMLNEFEFTVSPQAQANLQESMESGNNITQFMESEGYIRLEAGCKATSVDIYAAYSRWCKDNLEKPLSATTFKQYLSQNAEQYGLEYSKHIINNRRGYRNILVQINPDRGDLSNNIWNV